MERSTKRTITIVLVWALLALALFGTFILTKRIGEGGNTAALYFGTRDTHEILVYGDRAEPTSITAKIGDEIIFIISDDSHHTIAEERSRKSDARLESGELREGDTYALTFSSKGVFSFYDRQNQSIRVIITVE